MNSLNVLSSRLFSRLTTNTVSKITKLKFARCSTVRTSRQTSNRNLHLPKTPDLIYMPHVFRWLKSKLRFRYLKKTWDPDFSEGAFIFGTTRAICKITEIINKGELKELDSLMTMSAKFKLQDDINYRLTASQKRWIVLKPEDIKILIPITVTFNKDDGCKMCRVSMRILALKWHEVSRDNYKLVIVALQTEFVRDYDERALQEWNISGFSILECAMVAEATVTKSN